MKLPTIPLALAALASLAACAPQAQSPTTAADNKPPILCTPRAASKAGRLATLGLGVGMAASALDFALFSGCEAVARTAPATKEAR